MSCRNQGMALAEKPCGFCHEGRRDSEGTEARMERIRSTDVRPGDIIHFLGHPHMVESVDERNAFGMPIARAADGWSIALDGNGWLDVSRTDHGMAGPDRASASEQED